jgi:RNA polymerase sigma-70 factor (ECF subfamily)
MSRVRSRMSAQMPAFPVDEEDRTLAERIRAGDIDAFASVFHRYYEPLVRAAFSYTEARDTAEDVVQDVLVAVWERHTEFARHVSVAAYLFGAVRNRALDFLAHASVVQRHATAAQSDTVPAVDELIFATELARAAHARIEALPPRVREVYRLRRDHALSNAEIADVLGITVHAVYVQMARAIKALRTSLAPWIDGAATPERDGDGSTGRHGATE